MEWIMFSPLSLARWDGNRTGDYESRFINLQGGHGEVRQFRADGFRRLADTGTRGADPFQPNRPTKKKKR